MEYDRDPSKIVSYMEEWTRKILENPALYAEYLRDQEDVRKNNALDDLFGK